MVIERTDVPLAQSNPLLSEVKAALADAAAAGEIEVIPELYGAVAGLGGNVVLKWGTATAHFPESAQVVWDSGLGCTYTGGQATTIPARSGAATSRR